MGEGRGLGMEGCEERIWEGRVKWKGKGRRDHGRRIEEGGVGRARKEKMLLSRAPHPTDDRNTECFETTWYM